MDHDLINNWVSAHHFLDIYVGSWCEKLEELCKKSFELEIVVYISYIFRLMSEKNLKLGVKY